MGELRRQSGDQPSLGQRLRAAAMRGGVGSSDRGRPPSPGASGRGQRSRRSREVAEASDGCGHVWRIGRGLQTPAAPHGAPVPPTGLDGVHGKQSLTRLRSQVQREEELVPTLKYLKPTGTETDLNCGPAWPPRPAPAARDQLALLPGRHDSLWFL